MVRIENARTYCRRLFDHNVAQAYAFTYKFDFRREPFEYENQDHCIQDLNDRKLNETWAAFMKSLLSMSDKFPAPISPDMRQALYDDLKQSRDAVLQRLNELERKR
jgi:hypothetical protein